MTIKSLRPQPDTRFRFLRGFLREPQQVGSVIPSSRFLERRLVSLAGVGRARTVVELGPGTGGTTRALLRELPRSARLLGIEIDPHFAALLQRSRDPRLLVECGSAEDLRRILGKHGLPAPDAIVSGIPFSTMDLDIGHRIVREIHAALAPGGLFVAYQVRSRVSERGPSCFGTGEIQREYWNIPPMRIYRWQKEVSDEPRWSDRPRRAAAESGP